MATWLPNPAGERGDLEQGSLSPSARELRAQAVQRLQGGLFGLAAIVLMVGLANIINDRARLAEAEAGKSAVPEATAPAAEPKNDPLAGGADPSQAAGLVPAKGN